MKNFLLQTFFFSNVCASAIILFHLLANNFFPSFFSLVLTIMSLLSYFFFRKTINSAIATYLIASHAGVYRGARALLKTPAWKATYLVN